MKSKYITYIIIFIGLIFGFDLFNKLLEKYNLSKIRYKYQEIENFVIVGRSSTDYYLKGKLIREFNDRAEIYPFNLTYLKDNKPVLITAEKGIYIKNTEILNLINNVKIKKDNLFFLTKNLSMDTKRNVATTQDKILVLTDRMRTEGNKAVIDLSKDSIKTFNVKTLIK
ncbi:MAG: hypothetical protein DSY66_01570 [Persephonella sp.]|nr:MAG: hypothetical protein DSY53_03940 [Persephonella sp.]RUM61646.1 MAG: hypothetical protein DSY66_01570 [Persephonella sp.]